MRVPNKILFDTSTHRLGSQSSAYYKANEVVTTGKRINHIHDDPMGLAQVMRLNSSIAGLDQLDKNMDMGKTWLDASDSAMDSMKELVIDVNLEISQLVSSAAGPQERNDAIARIDGMLRQIVDLGNTQVNGSYIFGGSRTDKPPFIYHDRENPPRVSYEGDDEAFRIRTGDQKSMEVGRDGSTIFYMDYLKVNETNHSLVFQEDRGLGPAYRKTMTVEIPHGSYTKEELAMEVEKQMNAASAEDGYGLSYTVHYDKETSRYVIREKGAGTDSSVRTEILWNTGGNPRVENAAVTGSIPPESLTVNLRNPEHLTLATQENEPMRLVWDGKDSFTIENNPGYVLPGKVSPVNGKILLDLSDNGRTDLEITVDMEGIQAGDSIELNLVPFTGMTSIGRDMGFYGSNTSLLPPVSSTTPPYITAIEIGGTNQNIDFREIHPDGSSVDLTASISPKNYESMEELTAEIKRAMEEASHDAGQLEVPPRPGIEYAVSYDPATSRFMIREEGSTLHSLELLWETGSSSRVSSAGESLGFHVNDMVIESPVGDAAVLFDVTPENNRINFTESFVNADGEMETRTLTAVIPAGAYTSVADFEDAVSQAMTDTSEMLGNGVIYDLSYGYDPITGMGDRRFSMEVDASSMVPPPADPFAIGFLWESGGDSHRSMGAMLGYDSHDVEIPFPDTTPITYTADEDAVLFRITKENRHLDFQEVDESGNPGKVLSIILPTKEYTDPHELAADMEAGLREASPSGLPYAVGYDEISNTFSIRGGTQEVSEVRFLWNSGPNAHRSVGQTLGFDPAADTVAGFPMSDDKVVRVVLDQNNNRLDFREVVGKGEHQEFCELTAVVPEGEYTDMQDLAKAIEKAMEKESRDKGYGIRYDVTYDEQTGKFVIREEADRLHSLDLLFESGRNRSADSGGTGTSMAGIIGFSEKDISFTPMQSNRDVEWSLFRAMTDLMADLESNDVEGMEQGMQRLETSFQHVNSLHADTGIRFNRLEIQQSIHKDMRLSIKDHRSHLEDADMIEAIMNLQARELGYQAAMSSTSKIMKMSIMDYM
ncbi:flagellar hook-associated protein FlgL [Desulfobotulus sp. H1]|uniref:Flagellar hook-associated protein FlgL n=1 Tax=Desulfobotulus pelophilus TaxID=2823377 RepID=A0ABT3N4H7_9BACT|nr:flagellar hook-associated protein FlgL [Desulfobotulus pelophilus]MCW7752381.1 flagellar hook-associated protein FlgL [Desulfobotulus pelophilus]